MAKALLKELLQVRRLLAILAGGFLGTCARYFLSQGIQGLVGKGWPFDILIINVSGAFLLALLTTFADAAIIIGPHRRLFFNVGFLGAYTTFSTLALGDLNLMTGHHLWLAQLYLVCSLGGGILAICAGQYSGAVLIARRQRSKVAVTSGIPYQIVAGTEELLLNPEASRISLEEEEETF
jgi:Integral membrane protein possibly involved in chromosome condensation